MDEWMGRRDGRRKINIMGGTMINGGRKGGTEGQREMNERRRG